MTSRTLGHFRTKLIRVFLFLFFILFYFFSKEYCISFQVLLMYYLHVVMHIRRHLIQVKTHDQSDPGAFSYKIDRRFFFFLFFFFFFFFFFLFLFLKNIAFLSRTY